MVPRAAHCNPEVDRATRAFTIPSRSVVEEGKHEDVELSARRWRNELRLYLRAFSLRGYLTLAADAAARPVRRARA